MVDWAPLVLLFTSDSEIERLIPCGRVHKLLWWESPFACHVTISIILFLNFTYLLLFIFVKQRKVDRNKNHKKDHDFPSTFHKWPHKKFIHLLRAGITLITIHIKKLGGVIHSNCPHTLIGEAQRLIFSSIKN